MRRPPTPRAAFRPTADALVGLLDGPAGGYVHVPFCAWICPFCPYDKVRAEATLAARYGEALDREIAAVGAAHARRFGVPMTSLYVGGGTPTLYPELLAQVLDRLPTSGERAVEVLPNHATPEGLDHLSAMGFTAVSIGAQSFDDAVLRRLGRPHDAATARHALETAAGRFPCVDVDLIVDVALETEGPDAVARPGTFLRDVATCFDSGVDQVSTYPLMRFGFTPFGRAGHERRREHQVLAEVAALAARSGYERRSVWTFNRRGSSPYTSITRRRFLGMGAGATSVCGHDVVVNHFGVRTYCEAVEADLLPVARAFHLGRWAGAAYEAFWQAYSGQVDPTTLGAAYGRSVRWGAAAAAVPARLAGWIRPEGGAFRLTGRGFDRYHDLERAVTYRLIEPLWSEMLREHLTEGADVTPSCLPGDLLPEVSGVAGRRGVPSSAGAFWADPEAGRHGAAWALASALMERHVETAGSGRAVAGTT